MILRALLVWLLIAVVETAHGILRIKFLNWRVGDRRARQIGVLTGSILLLFVTWLTLPWIGATRNVELFGVGALWLVLMLAFDLVIGRRVMRFQWKRILADFNPRRGGLLGIGMLVLFAAPWIASHWR